LTTISESWAAGRARAAAAIAADQAPRRRSLVAAAAAGIAARLPVWRRVRTAVLTYSGLGMIDLAVWQWHTIAGCAAVGVSLLLAEWAGRTEARR
jgi:hypothetical protein